MPGGNRSSFSGCWVIGADFPAGSPSPDITAPAPGGRGGDPGMLRGIRAGVPSGSRVLLPGFP